MSEPLDFPFRISSLGRSAVASEAKHVRDLIELLLFTGPGERVMRPDFGTGLGQLVFAPNSPELAAATRLLVQSALQQWLGDRVLIEAVEVQSQDSTLRVAVQYLLRRTGERVQSQFEREV